MSRQTWVEALFVTSADGNTIANSATEAVLFNDTTIPGNYFQDGRGLRLRIFGKLSTTGTPTIQFGVRWGGVAGTLLCQTEALTMGSGVTNVNFSIELYIQTRSNGSTGTLLVMGDVSVNTSTSAVIAQTFSVSGFDAPVPVTSNLIVDTALSITAKWGTGSPSNTITGLMYYGESIN